MNIRYYKSADYPCIRDWWLATDQGVPTEEMLPKGTTFIMEGDDQILACMTMYLTNSKQFAMLDNLISNPYIDKPVRREAVKKLINHCEILAFEMGYKSLFCMSTKAKLTERYESHGYRPTFRGVTTLTKQLGEAQCHQL